MRINALLSIPVIVLAALIVGAILTTFPQQDKPARVVVPTKENAPAANPLVQARFDAKIIYNAPSSGGPGTLESDCANRGGMFNECGTVCEPGAGKCASVCAFTCELEQDALHPAAWKMYTDYELDFSIRYPQSAAVSKQYDDVPPAVSLSNPRVSLLFDGPTQESGTLLTDGFRFVIARRAVPAEISFERFVEQDWEHAPKTGAEEEVPKRITVSGKTGFSYTASGGAEKVIIYIPNPPYALIVEVETKDPNELGLAILTDQMVKTIKTPPEN